MSSNSRLLLVNGFDLRCNGASIPLGPGHQRLLAFLGLHATPVTRARVASMIWPERTDSRAAANLRSLLFRLPKSARPMLWVDHEQIALTGEVGCDVQDFVAFAHRLLEDRSAVDLELRLDMVSLTHDLLPGWYDEWVLVERERLHQLRLHVLDKLCARLSAQGRHGEAVEAGLASVRSEPIRESGREMLIRAYLAEGNATQARVQYERYADLLKVEMGLTPHVGLRDLVFDDVVDSAFTVR